MWTRTRNIRGRDDLVCVRSLSTAKGKESNVEGLSPIHLESFCETLSKSDKDYNGE